MCNFIISSKRFRNYLVCNLVSHCNSDFIIKFYNLINSSPYKHIEIKICPAQTLNHLS